MRADTIFLKSNRLAVLFGCLFFASATFAQDNEQVKVKVKKIIDGDTTVTEETMSESEVEAFTKQFENDKGKNKQLMITVENLNKKEGHPQSMSFKAMIDSTMAHAFSFSDSSFDMKFDWNDSSMKNFAKNFKFDFDPKDLMADFNIDIDSSDDGRVVIINKKNQKRISVTDDEDSSDNENINSDNTKTRKKSIVIEDENGRPRKKVIVSTSVSVIDMDDEKHESSKARSKKIEKETDFSFYPNPNDGDFILELNTDEKKPAIVTITDINGKEIYNEKISGNGRINKSISLNDKKGTFIVTIKQDKKIISKKIIID